MDKLQEDLQRIVEKTPSSKKCGEAFDKLRIPAIYTWRNEVGPQVANPLAHIATTQLSPEQLEALFELLSSFFTAGYVAGVKDAQDCYDG
ncbi:MAG: hypothetical protein IK114_14075 [Fibrobacter sp.]|nr:hypothetical protein [Fibrobacter sp.]